MRRTVSWIVLTALLASGSAAGATPNLNDWMAIAPVVLVGRVVMDHEPYIDVEVTRSFRGAPRIGDRIRVNQKGANREREIGKAALEMEAGASYLLLLTLSAKGKPEGSPIYDLVRGTEGAREIPREGGAVLLEAAERLAQIQDRKDDRALWQALEEMLEETNPILVETSLALFVKFRRGDTTLLPSLRPLLDHPREDFRTSALTVIGQILERRGAADGEDTTGLVAELIGHARRDSSIPVRAAATRALGSIRSPSVDEILKEIARDDPDQAVRYEAERLLYERGLKQPPTLPQESAKGAPRD